MQALTIFAGTICFTLTQRDQSLFWLFSLLVLWPLLAGVTYLFIRIIKYFLKKTNQPKSKLNSQLKKLVLVAYGLSVVMVVASSLTASREIINSSSGCGEVVNNDLSNLFISVSLNIFWIHLFLVIAYLLEPVVNKKK